MKTFSFFILFFCFLTAAGLPAAVQENDSDAREVVIPGVQRDGFVPRHDAAGGNNAAEACLFTINYQL
jgi:hypothetical protein